MASFYGPSGYGKSFAAAYTANRYNAYHVQCKSGWTRGPLLKNLLKEMGIHPAKDISEMTDQVSEQLLLSGRPLIIDEFDHIVKKKCVELIRDIYEGSNAPILLIGEENLEHDLSEWERFHNRIMDWIPAQPASLDDVRLLRKLYCQDVQIGDDILNRLIDINAGCVRRIRINLHRVQKFAIDQGLNHISLTEWGNQPFYTGKVEKRKV